MSNTVVRLIIVFLALVVQATAEGSEFERKCPRFQVMKHTIIRTQASKANGAIYLGTGTVPHSRDCYDLCCTKENCNLVLLKFLQQHEVTCYLFNCGSPSKCLFRAHSSFTNYVAIQFEDQESDDSISSKTHRRLYDQKEAVTEEVLTTSSQPHVDQDRNKGYDWQSKVAKTTQESQHWYHKTTTSAPYRETDHTVTTDNKGNWSGKKWGEISTNPYDSRKDGFTSDEKTSLHKSFVTTKAPAAVDWHQGTQKESHQGYDGSESTFDRSHAPDLGKVNPETSKPPKNELPEDDGSFGKNPEEEEFERRVWIDNNPDYPTEPKFVVHSNKPIPTNAPTKASTKHRETKSSIIINRFNIQQSKAVIPLAVGLIIALLLLMAVVFRMRTSRRRRTKAFLTDDADYLINGMYL